MKTKSLFLALALCSSLFFMGGNRVQAAELQQTQQLQQLQGNHVYHFDLWIEQDSYLTILAPETDGSHWEFESAPYGFNFEGCDYSVPKINTIQCWGERGSYHVILHASGNHNEKAELFVSVFKR